MLTVYCNHFVNDLIIPAFTTIFMTNDKEAGKKKSILILTASQDDTPEHLSN